ncbi:MAG: metallophosphoesterase [Planctomycetaceae bacterium]|jgi:predicted phosphodiesterase|nr:metallophosphoesterase [Planctomycetaceae bacterium]
MNNILANNISRRHFLISTGVLGIAANTMLNGTLAANETQSETQSKLLRFAVISDTHFENKRGEGAKVKVPKALKNLLFKKPPVDAIFVAGDLTDRGRQEEYDQLKAVFDNKDFVPEGVNVHYLMGNHDHIDPNGQKYYLAKLQQPLHQFIDIGGYPFITISLNSARASGYNESSRQFLADNLEKSAKDYSGKPVFVFMHVPPLDTCYGSLKHEGWGTDVLLSILNKYPQAVVFAGHSHFPIGDPRSIHQDKFTSINVGSTTYSEVERGIVNAGIHPEQYKYVTEGIIVNIFVDGNIEIERWDTYRNEEILPRWSIKSPHDGSQFSYKNRKGLPAPAFAAGTKPIIDITKNSCTITFPQATENEVVFRYTVDIIDNGNTILSTSKFSQFYLNSKMPDKLSVQFSDLPVDKKLLARVRAYDSYNNSSEPIECEIFIVPKPAVQAASVS